MKQETKRFNEKELTAIFKSEMSSIFKERQFRRLKLIDHGGEFIRYDRGKYPIGTASEKTLQRKREKKPLGYFVFQGGTAKAITDENGNKKYVRIR